jgi:hypothetical protein
MAISITPFFESDHQMQQMHHQLQAEQSRQRKAKVGPDLSEGKPPAGSLIIADYFSPSNPSEPTHGELVGLAARGNGFRGPVITSEQPFSEDASDAQFSAENLITNPKSSKGEMLEGISGRTAVQAISLVENQTKVVRNATASGAKNSVLNLSVGGSKAGITSELYSHASLAWDEKATPEDRDYGSMMAGNFARAYDLNKDHLLSDDPKVSGPERARLQQHLVKHVDHTVNSSTRMKSAQKAWATEVRRFESGHNSVVISAGNHGDASDQMIKDAGSARPMVPSDYEKNFLEIPEVTSVGAVSVGEGRSARYSSRSDGVDIYASGSVDYDGDKKADDTGTSFSAPRVGATMAELHRQNPKMNSAQVENLMRNSLTRELNTGSGKIQVLDTQKN